MKVRFTLCWKNTCIFRRSNKIGTILKNPVLSWEITAFTCMDLGAKATKSCTHKNFRSSNSSDLESTVSLRSFSNFARVATIARIRSIISWHSVKQNQCHTTGIYSEKPSFQYISWNLWLWIFFLWFCSPKTYIWIFYCRNFSSFLQQRHQTPFLNA